MLHFHAFFVIDGGACIDAEHDVLDFGVGLSEVVSIIGGDERESHFAGEVDGAFKALSLDFESGVLNFEVEAIAEDAGVPFDKFAGFVGVISEEESGEFGGGATGEADDTFAAFFEEWAIDAWFVVEAFEVGGGGESDEVIEAFAVHGEECEVCSGFFLAACGAIGAYTWSDIGFVTEDGSDAAGFAGIVEFDGSVEVAVVRDGDGVHAM